MEIKKSKKKVFIAYSRKDVDLMSRLRTHLKILERNNLIDVWSDSEIEAGKNWDNEIKKKLFKADIILLLISADFIASDYCYEEEMKLALKQHEERKSIVIPIILKECLWKQTLLGGFQALPNEGKPITHGDWTSIDIPLNGVVRELMSLIVNLSDNRNEGDYKIGEGQDAIERNRSYKETNNVNSNFSNSNDIQIQLKLTLEEMCFGAKKIIEYERIENCNNCKGGLGMGKCSVCASKGYLFKEQKMTIEIPPGIEEGMILNIKNMGHQFTVSGKKNNFWEIIFFQTKENFGTLLINVLEKKHDVFTRDGSNLLLIYDLSIFEAMLGVTKEIELLNKEKIKIKFPARIQDGKIFRLKRKGFPRVGSFKIGDLLIKIKIYIPEDLTEKEKKLLEKIKNSDLFQS